MVSVGFICNNAVPVVRLECFNADDTAENMLEVHSIWTPCIDPAASELLINFVTYSSRLIKHV